MVEEVEARRNSLVANLGRTGLSSEEAALVEGCDEALLGAQVRSLQRRGAL